jgi:putative endonuclease
MSRSELGMFGEEQAAALLEKEGYRILERNFRCRFGEIDLIARRRDILAFVEVKLRKNASYGEAREFVTPSKQRRLRLAASWYLSGRLWAQTLQPRFDVVEIYAPQGADGPLKLSHLEDAFV